MIVNNVKYIDERQPGLMPLGVRPIDISELQEFVSIALKEDEDLLTKYSSYYSVEELIQAQVNNTIELLKTKEVKCYGVFLDDTPVGFTVVAERLLYSFGINVYCRQAPIVLEWYKWIRSYFNDNFLVVLYRENTRAINFFIRNGMEEFSDDGKVVYLINKN